MVEFLNVNCTLANAFDSLQNRISSLTALRGFALASCPGSPYSFDLVQPDRAPLISRLGKMLVILLLIDIANNYRAPLTVSLLGYDS